MEPSEVIAKALPLLNTLILLVTVVMLMDVLYMTVTARHRLEDREKRKAIELVQRNNTIATLKAEIIKLNDEMNLVIHSTGFKSNIREERNPAYLELQTLQTIKNGKIHLLEHTYSVFDQEEDGVYDGYRLNCTVVPYSHIRAVFDTLIPDNEYSNIVIRSLMGYGYTYIPMCLAKDMLAMSAVMGIRVD